MVQVCTEISVAGFNNAEITEGLQDFLAELSERPWLINPRAEWDAARTLLLVTVQTEGNNPKLESVSVLDEVRDCVIACFDFASEISFNIEEAKLIP
jgi:hypothetical protein